MSSQAKQIGEVATYFAELGATWQKEIDRLSDLSFAAWENCQQLESHVLAVQEQHARSQYKIAMAFCKSATVEPNEKGVSSE